MEENVGKNGHGEGDFRLLWTALLIITSLGILIFACFQSVGDDILQMDERLSIMEEDLAARDQMRIRDSEWR